MDVSCAPQMQGGGSGAHPEGLGPPGIPPAVIHSDLPSIRHVLVAVQCAAPRLRE